MNMVTTCPSCGTMFKIQPTALAAHGGEGRCSVCQHVFNTLEHMSPIGDAAGTASWEASAANAPATTFVDTSPADPIPDESPPEVIAPTEQTVETPPDHTEPPPVELPETLFQKKRFSWPSFLKPMSAAMVLLLVALVQTSLLFKTQIISQAPSLYPALSGLCKVFSCVVPMPSQAKLIAIEDYRLRSHPDYADVLILESTLHNRAAYALAYPLLHLTLTDDFNAPVADRTFKPADYLSDPTDQDKGIKGNTSVSVLLYLGVSGIKSSKYKLIAQDILPAAPATEETPS